MNGGHFNMGGFTLLPVMLTMALIAAVAFTLNRDNGLNVAMVSGQTDSDRARYAAEAGLQAANAQVQLASCGGGFPVSGTPVVNSAFSGASYQSYATSAGGNTTGLVATGTYNGTSVTLTRSGVYVFQNAARTYTLQPGPAAGLDTYIDSSTESNFGATDSLAVKKNQQSLLFKFDLSAFPAGSRPVSSTFSIYATSGFLGGLDYYRATRSWQEGTGASSPLDGATWNTSDGVTAWTGGGEHHAVKVNANTLITVGSNWADFDATDIVTAWLEADYPNHGILVKSTGELGTFRYASSDESDASKRPKLAITYLVPCGSTGPQDPGSGTVTLAPAADSFNDSGAVQANNGAATSLKVYYTPTRENRSLLRFDTSSVPAGSSITSAKLRVYVSAVGSTTANTKSIWANAVNDTWAEGSGINTNKSCPTATAGTSWSYSTNCTAWTYVHPPDTAPAWATMAAMPTARSGHAVAMVNGKIYAIGGFNSSGYLRVVEEYDPATNTWATRANMPTRRAETAAAVIGGKIYVVGGTDGGVLDKTEVYDPATNNWVNRRNMPQGRKYLAAAAANGRLYAIGGVTNSAAVKTNEEYNPTADSWATRAAMPTARMWLAAQYVGNRIYAIGGYAGASSLAATEAYDPTGNSWSSKAAMAVATDSMASAVIGNRMYLVSGFQGATTVKFVSSYDTINNAHMAQLDYPIAANEPAAAVVNGRLYSMGGDNNSTTYYANHYRLDTGNPDAVAFAVDESNGDSPLSASFNGGWITFELKALVQEWVDGVRPNNGLVIRTEIPDQFSINSREANNKAPQLVVNF